MWLKPHEVICMRLVRNKFNFSIRSRCVCVIFLFIPDRVHKYLRKYGI